MAWSSQLTYTHSCRPYSAEQAIDDGVDCLEHIISVLQGAAFPPASLVTKIKDRAVLVDPTLVVFRNMILLSDLPEVEHHPDNDRVPQQLKNHWAQAVRPFRKRPFELRRNEFTDYQRSTRELHQAGVSLLVGSDTPEPYCPPGWALHQELELLVESGIAAADVLPLPR